MSRPDSPRVAGVRLYFLPVETRVPLKFGPETLTTVSCARVALTLSDGAGRRAEGWGETPLNVQWVWPGSLGYEERHQRLRAFTGRLARAWSGFDGTGHALEMGYDFIEHVLPGELAAFNDASELPEPMPHLAALVCCSPFDIALHDACGKLHDVPVYETYTKAYLNRDLAAYLEPADGADVSFEGRYPDEFLTPGKATLPAWHLVGGLDKLEPSEVDATDPDDGYPVDLRAWIRRDGLTCLKIKLRGNDAAWDYERLMRVGDIAREEGVTWLTTDFNCTVTNPSYVTEILDRLMMDAPDTYGRILYVEQPFPYDLEANRIDVHAVSARKPLFMDESAHDWRLVRLGRRLGWTGVALKTCKTQTGALLSLCWAKAHGMTLMVQDLTNPMLAQIPHALLAAHAGTIMGVETNGMQFYPEASGIEAAIHPGLYQRRNGMLDLSTLRGAGFGYRVDEIARALPAPVYDHVE